MGEVAYRAGPRRFTAYYRREGIEMTISRIDQVQMTPHRLSCPVDAAALRDLKLGDLVYLDGVIFTGREGLYQRYLSERHIDLCR